MIGKKTGMTQLFQPDGTVVPVTVLRAGPCVAVLRRTIERDGYEAVQLGLVEPARTRRVNRPGRGAFEKLKLPPSQLLEEFRMLGEVKPGDSIGASEFSLGELVDVTGTSKGLGFTGVMRRHGFSGGGASHGSMFHRAPGSIGASAYPSRVLPGMRAAGRAGGCQVTVKNLEVVRIDAENNLILVRGAVPGPTGGTVTIRRSKAGARTARGGKDKTAAGGKK